MLIPTCEQCGRCGCECVPLPHTMTVTLAGLGNRTHSAHCEIEFEATFGSGARAVVTTIADGSGCRAITGVALIEGGSCYARLGRVAPSVTVAGGSGQGAEFTPTLTSTTPYIGDGCTIWSIGSVAVSGGTGYIDGESLTVAINGTVIQQPNLTINVERLAPTISATVGGGACGGTGAALSVVVTQNVHAGRPTWGVDSVTVESAGDDYTDGTSILFTVQAGGVVLVTAIATISVTGGAPNIGDVQYGQPIGGGTGVVGDLQFVLSGGEWYLEVTLSSGGSGYSIGDMLWWYSEINGQSLYSVAAVDENGSVTEMTLIQQDPWPPNQCGPIDSVTVTQRGAYYIPGQGIEAVNVVGGGIFYVEDASQQPCIATVTATACGHPATLSISVDGSPTSPTFGQVIAVNIVNGGAGPGECPPPWDEICTDHSGFNSDDANGQRPFVLRAVNPINLVGVMVTEPCFGSGACITAGRTDSQVECPAGTPIPIQWDGTPTSLNYATVTSSGSGYAKRGRVSPTLNVGVSGGNASFSATFTQQTDSCDIPYWQIATITVASTQQSGTLYDEGQSLPIGAATAADIVGRAATAIVHTQHTAPTLTASVAGGNGATISVTVDNVDGGWAVSDLTLVSGGSGYPGRSNITFTAASRDITLDFAHGVALANESGEIVAVILERGGLYYHDTGIPASVTVQDGGEYWRDDNTLPPHVQTPTATVVQLPPGTGSGATISLTVGSDPTNNTTFGRVTSATLTSGGSGYSLWGAPLDCEYRGGCGECGTDYAADPYAMLKFRGLGKAPLLEVVDPRYGTRYIYRASSVLSDCAALPTNYPMVAGAPSSSATVEAGGSWDSRGTDCYNRGGGGGTSIWFNGCLCEFNDINEEQTYSLTAGDVTCTQDGCTGPVPDQAFGSVGISGCCVAECNEDGECILKANVGVSVYYKTLDDKTVTIECAVCTDALSIDENGFVTGSVTLPCEQIIDGVASSTTASVTFGS